MLNEDLEAIKKYSNPGNLVLSSISICLFIAIGVIVSRKYVGATVILCAIAVGLLIYFIVSRIKFKKELQRLASGEFHNYLGSDFRNGKTYLNDRLRIGEVFVFSKNSGVYVINDIKQIYEYVHRTNGIEDQRNIRIVYMVNGKRVTRDMCKLSKKQEEELKQVMIHLKVMNKDIMLGYR